MGLKKEIVDQPLHFLWAGATFLLPWVAVELPVGRGAVMAVAVLSLLVLCSREVWQKRDKKPHGIFSNWPWLDFTFYVLGAAVGTVVGVLCI